MRTQLGVLSVLLRGGIVISVAIFAGCCFGPSGSYKEIDGSVDPEKGSVVLPVKEYKTEPGRSIHSLECGRGTVGQPQTIGEVAVPVLFCKEAIPDVYRLNEKEGSFVFEIEGKQEAFKGYCYAFTIPGRSTINYAIHLSTEERLR